MRQALEDLIEAVEAAINAGDWKVDGACDPTLALIRAKEALAQPEQIQPSVDLNTHQPEQEPVAVKFPRHEKQSEDNWMIDPAFITRVNQSIDPETPWDFIPKMEQIETTLLALEVIPSNLYTTPPQRKPLTEDKVWDAYMQISAEFDCNVIDLVEFARAIEAAHGIK